MNQAYEKGDQNEIEKLILEFGQDPEAIVGEDTASRLIKTIRRIAQLRRRLDALQQGQYDFENADIYRLKKTVTESEEMGGDPLGDLQKKLMQEISERKIQLELIKSVC